MTPPRVRPPGETPRVIQGDGFIDEVVLMSDPRRVGWALLVRREYARVAEGLDLTAGAAWVMWRKAMQGPE